MLKVLVNLITNGIEAAAQRKGGEATVHVSTAVVNDAVEVVVADSGAGVAQDQLESLFSFRGSTKPDGLGLGLLICKRVVEHYGGKIWHTARSGGGAEFHFTISKAL